MRRSCLDELFADLPVLILDRFQDLSEERLHVEYSRMRQRRYNMDKLDTRFWYKQMRTLRDVSLTSSAVGRPDMSVSAG